MFPMRANSEETVLSFGATRVTCLLRCNAYRLARNLDNVGVSSVRGG